MCQVAVDGFLTWLHLSSGIKMESIGSTALLTPSWRNRMWAMRVPLLAVFAILVTSACYHAMVDTGRAPNGVQIEKPWANSFVYGLVPPDVVETASQCPNGLARVETRHSFLNGLVAGLTFGIYTPMEITVSCAGSTASVEGSRTVAAGETPDSHRSAMQTATELTRRTEEPIYVRF